MTYEGNAHNVYTHADGIRRAVPCDHDDCDWCQWPEPDERWGTGPRGDLLDTIVSRAAIVLIVFLMLYLAWHGWVR